MEKKKHISRYMKVTIITVVFASVIMGAVFGVVYDKDRIVHDIRRLKLSVSIANALNSGISVEEGFILISQAGSHKQRKIEITTLKSIAFKEKTVQVYFKSLFFSDSIEMKKTDTLQTALKKE